MRAKGNCKKSQRPSLPDSGHNRVYGATASDELEQALSMAKKLSAIYAEKIPLMLKSTREETGGNGTPSELTELTAKSTANALVAQKDRKAVLEQITSLVDGISEKAKETAPKSKSTPATLKTPYSRYRDQR